MDWTTGPPDTWNPMADWLRSLAADLPGAPKAILVISGHWEENEFSVSCTGQPSLIYDYYGFPEHTYSISYPAAGAPELADRVQALLVASHIPCVKDPVRGLDHGVFIPLKLIFPDASIPVVCLSLQNDLDPERHLAAGLALLPLREENVLIIGSGMSYHNMSGFRVQSGKPAIPESEAFDDWLTATCGQKGELRRQQLLAWESAPFARVCHPREEHLLPLMVAAGAASGNFGKRVFSDTVMGAQVAGFRFG